MRGSRAAAAAAAAVTAGVVAAAVAWAPGSPPAGGQQASYQIDLAGNFAGNGAEELFTYVSGAGADHLVAFGNSGMPGGELTIDEYEFTVSGSYFPVAGNFDGDPHDEILWYAPGAGQDSIWDFNGWQTRTSRLITVSGDYWPTAGDFTGDGTDDVLWYGKGSGADSLWDFDPNGKFTVHPLTISGSYEPISGSFGSNATDDVLWYAAGSGPDYLWDFTPGGSSYASRPLPVGGEFWPVELDAYAHGWGGGDIVWYAPGTDRDFLWDFQGGTHRSSELVVGGNYAPVGGDLFGDGHEDVLWLDAADNGFNLWDHSPDGAGGVARHLYNRSPSSAPTPNATAAAPLSAAESAEPIRRAPE